MAEGTLSATFASLYNLVGQRFLNNAAPSGDDLTECKRIANDACRMFYSLHDWHFLHPHASIVAWATATSTADGAPSKDNGTSTVTADDAIFYDGMVGTSVVFSASENSYEITATAGDHDTAATSCTVSGDASGEADADTITVTSVGRIRLPDDFGYQESDLTHTGNTGYGALVEVSAAQLRAKESLAQSSGVPRYYAIEPVAHATTGQRWNLMVYPWPAADYTLECAYKANPPLMTSGTEYPAGGQDFGACLLQAALAEGEMEYSHKRAIENEKLHQVALPAAIRLDGRLRPRTVGSMVPAEAVRFVREDPGDHLQEATVS